MGGNWNIISKLSRPNQSIMWNKFNGTHLVYLDNLTQFIKFVEIHVCDYYDTCKTCITFQKCSWDIDKQRCTNKQLPSIIGNNEICPTINGIKPTKISSEDDTIIEVFLDKSIIRKDLVCKLDGNQVKTRINFLRNTVECLWFGTNNQSNLTHHNILIEIIMENNKLFAQASIPSVNCKFNSCSKCVQNPDCIWCSATHKCYFFNKICDNLSFKFNETDKCPIFQRIEPSFISINRLVDINIHGINLPEPRLYERYYSRIKEERYICEYISYNNVKCPIRINDNGNVFSLGIQFDIELENTIVFNKLTVEVFNCSHQELGDCGTCNSYFLINSAYKCTWAQSNTCLYDDSKSLSTLSVCENSVISKFNPSKSSINVPISIRINGTNLGVFPEDIIWIKIGDLSCVMNKDTFMISKGFDCVTKSKVAFSDYINVMIKQIDGSNIILRSPFEFSFYETKIIDFYPKKGMILGGSRITIYGENFDIGNLFKIIIGTECKTISLNQTVINCIATLFNLSSFATKHFVSIVFENSIDYTIYSNDYFGYISNSIIDKICSKKYCSDQKTFTVYKSGGMILSLEGANFLSDSYQVVSLHFYNDQNRTIIIKPTFISNSTITFTSPNLGVMEKIESTIYFGISFDYNTDYMNFSKIYLQEDPHVYSFENNIYHLNGYEILFRGKNLGLLSSEDITVQINEYSCQVFNTNELFVCKLNESTYLEILKEKNTDLDVKMYIGNLIFDLGKLKIYKRTNNMYIYIITPGVIITILIMIILYFKFIKNKNRKIKSLNEKRIEELNLLESKYAHECREAFVELLIDSQSDSEETYKRSELYWESNTILLNFFFPNNNGNCFLPNKKNESCPNHNLLNFQKFIKSVPILTILIESLESINSFNTGEKCRLASLICVAFYDDMEFLTCLMESLLGNLISRSIIKKSPKLLLRRTESVAEKLLTNWLLMNLHPFIKTSFGKHLIDLLESLKYTLNRGPIDFYTNEAKYSLSEQSILRQPVEFQEIKIGVKCDIKDDENKYNQGIFYLTLLDIDTITQTINKILDKIFNEYAHSKRPSCVNFHIYLLSDSGIFERLKDFDESSIIEKSYIKINTLKHYRVGEDCTLLLKMKNHTKYSDRSDDENNTIFAVNKPYHLTKPNEQSENEKKKDTQHGLITEVYFTRLLRTKAFLQKNVNKLMENIFNYQKRSCDYPKAIKYFLDYVDKLIEINRITDKEVVKIWKNNSIIMRFWVNIIKNANLIMDINIDPTVEPSLNVIVQLLMDSCSTNDSNITKNSSSNKLLYIKEIKSYKNYVDQYYDDIKKMPTVNIDQIVRSYNDMNINLNLDKNTAISEIMTYFCQYKTIVCKNINTTFGKDNSEKLNQILEKSSVC